MTAKRFTYKGITATDIEVYDYDKVIGQFRHDMMTGNSLENMTNLMNALHEVNEQLKKELRIYRKVASCSNCKYHNYDWDIDDGYGGEEYEVCDKGNDVTDGICEDWEEL